ncbi:hypothetical protein [Ruminococcus albus]|uniref:Uncharacterized protein n=1 Tax=Ruminococcus albus TaxID=1264 RepID=A0A1I1MLH5_RUMAL|nr:hypothetical protein [Ruminococcus albus]SFC86259.1 hypothetical protein SAMN02910406_02525 [Ruminococcus albus]
MTDKHELLPEKDKFPFGIISTLILLAIIIIVGVILCIQHGSPVSDLFSIKVLNPSLYLLALIVLYIIFDTVKYIIRCIKKNIVLSKGEIKDGEIVSTSEVPFKSIRGKSIMGYKYIYGVKLGDGSIIYTECYENDIVRKYRFRTCKVHEFKGRFRFDDFKS